MASRGSLPTHSSGRARRGQAYTRKPNVTEPQGTDPEPAADAAPGKQKAESAPVGAIVGGVVGGVVGLLLFLAAVWWWWRRRRSDSDDASLIDDTKLASEPESSSDRDTKVPPPPSWQDSGSTDGVAPPDHLSDQATSIMPASGSEIGTPSGSSASKLLPPEAPSKLGDRALEHKVELLHHIDRSRVGDRSLEHKAAFLPQDEPGPSQQRSLPRPPLVQYEQDAEDVPSEPLIFPPRYKEAWGERHEQSAAGNHIVDRESVLRADDGGSGRPPA